jgi:hypothetical protein
MIKFTELFPKDMKYFLGENFSFEPWIIKVLNLYREFLIINQGFVNCKTNEDIKLPEGLKNNSVEIFKDKIDEVLKLGDLSKLIEYKDLII